jgi:hypothetical protein
MAKGQGSSSGTYLQDDLKKSKKISKKNSKNLKNLKKKSQKKFLKM